MKKWNKNTKIMAAFCLGAVLFATSAFAEVRTKTGYEQFKDAVKETMTAMVDYDSFTTSTMVTITHNDRVLLQVEDIQKQDNREGTSESSSITSGPGGITNRSYYYRDNSQHIHYSQ